MINIRKNLFTFVLFLFCSTIFFQINLVNNSSFEEYNELPTNYVKDAHRHIKYWHVPYESSPDYFYKDSTIFFQTNLVRNPSFEEYNELPTSYVKDAHRHIKYWYVPYESSPDYFHKDCKFFYSHVPLNSYGYYPAHKGNAYIGILPLNHDGYMEHLTGTLIKPLEKDKKYEVSFYIMFADSACRFAIKGIGAYLSKEINPLNYFTPPYYEYLITDQIKASIQTHPDSILLNGRTWTKVSGIYTAKGGEKYITLGKFYDPDIKVELIERYIQISLNEKKKERFYKRHKDMMPINPHYYNPSGEYNHNPNEKNKMENPYYFIDDVSVIELEEK